MIIIDKDKAHLTSSQNLNQIQGDEWNIIEEQKKSAILSDDCGTDYLRYPGYVFSNDHAADAYKRIYVDFVKNNIYTPSRGNLARNNNYIFIGIRPGHVYAHLSKADTAWLFGPSSTYLHKLLKETNIYPYFTNVYNEPDKPFNKDYSFIFKELMVIFYIYKNVYKMNEINLVFMGNYDEYPELVRYILNHKKFIHDFHMKLNCFTIWHPAYLSRSYNDSKFNVWKNQLINKNRTLYYESSST